MINLLDPVFWVEQLIDQCPLFEGRVFETVDNDNAALDFYPTPLALVYTANDSSDPNNMATGQNQKHDYQIAVKIVLRKTVNKRDRLNSADSRLIRACRLEVLKALLGWVPPDCNKPVEHVSGDLSDKDDLIFWVEKLTTNDYLRP